MSLVHRARARSYHTASDAFANASREFRPDRRAPQIIVAPVLSIAHRAPERRPNPTALRKLPGFARRCCLPAAVIVVVAASMTALAERKRVVAMAPFAAPAFAAIGLPVNPRGLAIEGVRAQLGASGDKKVLIVDGWIANVRAGEAAAPDLRIALRDDDGRELYVWTARAPADRLGRAERVRFAARLEAPPDGVKDAIVEFVDAKPRATRGGEGS
jgi:hypothetical protein